MTTIHPQIQEAQQTPSTTIHAENHTDNQNHNDNQISQDQLKRESLNSRPGICTEE